MLVALEEMKKYLRVDFNDDDALIENFITTGQNLCTDIARLSADEFEKCVSSKIAVMYAGRIVEYGTTDDIFYNPKHEYTKGLLKSIPRLDAKEHERLVPIEGTPIDLLNPPAGCPFAPRCSNCMKICLREMAPVTTFDDVHYTQCWMNQKEQMEREAAK